jgi:hypothetical protein
MNENTFEFTDEEFLDVLNMLIQADKAPGELFVKLENMDQTIGEDQLDSLGTIVLFAWINQLFDISNDKLQKFTKEKVFTSRAIKDFVMVNCARSHTYEQAVEFIKKCS